MVEDHYLYFLKMKQKYDPTVDDARHVMQSIVDDFDFIAVTERMDESAVVLAMLLRIPLSDVLYLAAKQQGGYDDAGGGDNRLTCKVITPTNVTRDMQAVLDGDVWQTKSQYDLLLYEAANRSLDRTIDTVLGRDAFEQNLQKYMDAVRLAKDRCLSKTVFPCDQDGKYHPPPETDCLWNDSACGGDCLDEIADQLDLWKTT